MTSNPNQQVNQPGQYDLVLVDQSKDAELAAQAEADARLTEELNEGGRFKRFVKSIWKGNIAKDYYRHKYKKEAEQRIVETQDVLIHESTSGEHRDMAMLATIERFQSEYDEMIHDEAGESRHEVRSDSEIAASLKGIIRDFAEGRLNDTNLLEERARILQAYREENGQDLAGAGKVQIDNLLDVARAVRGAVEHGESLDAIIDGMKVISGESRSGVRTEVNASRTDQIFEKLGKSKVGTLIGSEVTIAAATIAMSVLRFGSKRAVGAAAMTVAPGIGAGLLAGLREKKRVKDDWAQHSREMAQGKVYDEATAARRREMEQTRYQTVSASDLIAELGIHLEEGALDTDDALRTALEQLSAITARENYSDINKVDLISYSAATEVERERFQLAVSRAQLKVLLRDRLSDDDTVRRLGLTPGMDIDALVQAGADNFTSSVIEGDVANKDAAFKKLRNRRVAKAAAAGVAVGLTFGIAGQELGASLSSSREGLVEQLWSHSTELHNGSQHNTLLNGLVGGSGGSHEVASSLNTQETFGSRGEFSGNIGMHQNPDGTLSFTNSDGDVLADKLEIRPSGRLTDESIATLQGKGFHVEDASFREEVTHKETVTVGAREYLQNHSGDTTKVTRDLWYDNNTPAPVFEQNELGLHWGGAGGSGLTENGDIQFSVATMQEGGSYHGDQEAIWQREAREGNLKLAISATGNTQDTPFLVDIRPDGTVDIPQDHPANQFFSNENGRAVFNGRYAEVVQMTGVDQNGVEHIRPLATHVGENNLPPLQDVVETKDTIYQPRYDITAPPVQISGNDFTEMAPVISVEGRRSMEAMKRRQERETPYYYTSQYGSRGALEKTLDDLKSQGSPRLLENPDVSLDTGEELSWFRKQLEAQQGEEYIRGVESAIDSSPELSQISDQLESIVTIPVKANGREESQSIFNLLAAYSKQDDEALKHNLILLHVNWPEVAASNPEDASRIQKTLAEIERARNAFPNLKIATIESQWSQQDLQGGVIGRVADRMRDASLLAVERAIASGKMQSNQEVQIIRNDADAKGIHRGYLAHYQKAFRDSSEADVLTGTTRFDQRRASELPGMVLGQNFASMVDIFESSRHGKVHTGGANFGVRASMLAAIGPVLSANSEKGVGSDDVMIGRIIAAARTRNVNYTSDRPPRPFFERRRRRRSGNDPYYNEPIIVNTDRKISKRVIGAQIDTDSQRSEEVYLAGGNFHQTWDENFDTGGHKDRGNGLSDSELQKRRTELRGNIEEQVSRLQEDMRHTIKIAGGYNNPAVKSALAVIFSGMKTEAGYILRGSNIVFTNKGRQYLRNSLERDSRGRFDPYGSRLSRQLYGEVARRSQRLTRSGSPLVSVT